MLNRYECCHFREGVKRRGHGPVGLQRYSWEQPGAGDAGCGCFFVMLGSCAMGVVFKIWEKIGDYFAWDKDDRWLYFLWLIGVIIVVVIYGNCGGE